MDAQKFKECMDCVHHKSSGCKFPREQVPIMLFKKDKFGEYSKTCEDCKKHQSKSRQKLTDKHKILVKETNEKFIRENQPFRYCSNKSHKSKNSLYSVDKVPIELFKKKIQIYLTNTVWIVELIKEQVIVNIVPK